MTTKKQQTRDKILSQAWQLFEQQSYAETTTRQIASSAGVAAGTVFSHFPTKFDLLKAGVERQVDMVIAEAAASDEQQLPGERLLHYARYLYGYYLRHREFSREIFKEVIWHQEQLNPQIEEFKQRLFETQEGYDDTRAQVMMELYFMTLIMGLNEPESDTELLLQTMLATLQNKLQCVSVLT